MMEARHIGALFITLMLAVGVVAATPLESSSAPERARSEGRGHAYLFRGLIGLIDWGMDELAGRITRTGVSADINSHLAWRSVATEAVAAYRRDPAPITVIGHSIGGDSAIEFAKYLAGEHVPVSLLITYDPTRMADKVPSNVERYLNLYQSSNILGGGDLVQGHGFHGHYASFNLKDRAEIIHINLDKFDRIQEQLAKKIAALASTPHADGEAVPIRLVTPASGSIELWDSGMPIAAHSGDTLQSLAVAYHVPVWALAQLNRASEHATLSEGDRIVVPRYLTPKTAPNRAASVH